MAGDDSAAAGEGTPTNDSPTVEPANTILSANFDNGLDGFAYSDDTFRGTNQPNYADSLHSQSGGFTGGAAALFAYQSIFNDLQGQ